MKQYWARGFRPLNLVGEWVYPLISNRNEKTKTEREEGQMQLRPDARVLSFLHRPY